MTFNIIIGLLLLLSFCVISASAFTHKSNKLNISRKQKISRFTLVFNSTEELFVFAKPLYFTDLINYVLYERMYDAIENIIKLKSKDPSLKVRLETLRNKAEQCKNNVNAHEKYVAEPGPFAVPETEQKAIEYLKIIKKLQYIVEKARKQNKISESSAESELAVLDIYRTQINVEYIFRNVEENIHLEKFNTAQSLLDRATALLEKKESSEYKHQAERRIKNYFDEITNEIEELYLKQKAKNDEEEEDQFEKQERWWKNT